MSQFIELKSPTSDVIRWLLNIDHIVQVRKVDKNGECMVALTTGGITPAETYDEVLSKLKIGPIA